MRFQTSQTTPAYLDRRLQFRMVSLVGLISIVMITLAVLNAYSGSQQAGDNSDLVGTYEARREERALSDAEIVLAGADDTDSKQSFAVDLAVDKREPFKPRNQERTGKRELFQQRAKSPTHRNPTRATSEFDTNVVDDDGQHHGSSPNSAPLYDAADEPENGDVSRQEPSFDEPMADDTEFADSPEPSRKAPRTNQPKWVSKGNSHPERNSVPANDFFDDDLPPSATNSGKRQKKSNEDGYAATPVPFDDMPRSDPIDTAPTDDLFMSDDSGVEPFLEDSVSVRIDKHSLDLVRDNEVGIRRDEADIFYWLLDHVRRVHSTTLERAGLREVQYINLRTEPDRFRGEPITIEGDLWRLYEFDAGRNDYDVTRMYEAWVFTGDSGNHPYRIVCTGLGKEIEPGENLRIPVRITGYFFKWEGYQSNGGVHIAPTLVASRIRINPTPNGIPIAPGIVPYIVVIVVAIGLALLVTVVSFAISDERSRRDGLSRVLHEPAVSFAGLSRHDPVSVEESLRQLAERYRQASVSGAYGPLLSRQAAIEHGVHDYAASRQIQVEQVLHHHQEQIEALQDWITRQKDTNVASDYRHPAQKPQSSRVRIDDDELNSDTFESAPHILSRPKSVTQPVVVTTSRSPLGSVQPATSTALHRNLSDGPIVVDQHTPNSSLPSSHSQSSASHGHAPPSTSYSASKLSDWEDEVVKMTRRRDAQK